MALDAANFIAELSITDPPGSDPLSQGDDQIRTIKRATFQSFPLIAAAVNITDVQMNLMAIKNEANVFTADQTLQDSDLILNDVADGGLQIIFQRSGVLRWTFTQSPDATNNEFVLARFSDVGAFLDRPFEVDRATGIVNFASVPTIKGDPIWTAGEVKMLVQGATLPSNNWFVMNGLNGTVDIRDRLLGAEGVFNGNTAPFLAAKTDAGSITGSTAISTAQMPVHTHRIWSGRTGSGITDTVLGILGEVSVVGANRGNAAPQYDLDTGFNDQIIEDSGSGSGHTHTIPELNVETDGADAFQVMPFSYFMQAIQYVP